MAAFPLLLVAVVVVRLDGDGDLMDGCAMGTVHCGRFMRRRELVWIVRQLELCLVNTSTEWATDAWRIIDGAVANSAIHLGHVRVASNSIEICRRDEFGIVEVHVVHDQLCCCCH